MSGTVKLADRRNQDAIASRDRGVEVASPVAASGASSAGGLPMSYDGPLPPGWTDRGWPPGAQARVILGSGSHGIQVQIFTPASDPSPEIVHGVFDLAPIPVRVCLDGATQVWRCILMDPDTAAEM
jgi:hypothetical protein